MIPALPTSPMSTSPTASTTASMSPAGRPRPRASALGLACLLALAGACGEGSGQMPAGPGAGGVPDLAACTTLAACCLEQSSAAQASCLAVAGSGNFVQCGLLASTLGGGCRASIEADAGPPGPSADAAGPGVAPDAVSAPAPDAMPAPPAGCHADADCDSGDPCRIGHCDAGRCTLLPANEDADCGVGDMCGRRACRGGACVAVATLEDDTPCGEAGTCTSQRCQGGVCADVRAPDFRQCDYSDDPWGECYQGTCVRQYITCTQHYPINSETVTEIKAWNPATSQYEVQQSFVDNNVGCQCDPAVTGQRYDTDTSRTEYPGAALQITRLNADDSTTVMQTIRCAVCEETYNTTSSTNCMLEQAPR
jgi:hypothetical protein